MFILSKPTILHSIIRKFSLLSVRLSQINLLEDAKRDGIKIPCPSEQTDMNAEIRLMQDQLSRLEPLLKQSSNRVLQVRGTLDSLSKEASEALCCGEVFCRVSRDEAGTMFEKRFVCLRTDCVKIFQSQGYCAEWVLPISGQPISKRATPTEVTYQIKCKSDNSMVELRFSKDDGLKMKWEWAIAQVSGLPHVPNNSNYCHQLFRTISIAQKIQKLMSRSLDNLNLPEKTKQYIHQILNPLLEELVKLAVREQPPNLAQFFFDHLRKHEQVHDTLANEVERLKV